VYTVNGTSILQLWSVTCHMGSQSVKVSSDTSEHTPPYNPSQPDRLVLDLLTQEGWKAELTWEYLMT